MCVKSVFSIIIPCYFKQIFNLLEYTFRWKKDQVFMLQWFVSRHTYSYISTKCSPKSVCEYKLVLIIILKVFLTTNQTPYIPGSKVTLTLNLKKLSFFFVCMWKTLIHLLSFAVFVPFQDLHVHKISSNFLCRWYWQSVSLSPSVLGLQKDLHSVLFLRLWVRPSWFSQSFISSSRHCRSAAGIPVL